MYFWGSHKLLQAHKKVCNENETIDMHIKMLLMEELRVFIGHMWKTCVMDINELYVDDY